MKREISVKQAASQRDFDLGTWLGRRQAFSMMAGKASAADIECLRTIRDQRLYKARNEKWGEFCVQHVGASKTQVDRLIRYLEEFGPQFFELTNVARISPETYRLIAGNVTPKGIRVDGRTIAIAQENAAQVSAAVAELRKRAEPPKPATPEKPVPVCHEFSFAALAIAIESATAAAKEVKSLRADEKSEIAALLRELDEAAWKLGGEE